MKHFKKYAVNEDYFKRWSHDMAYILGFWWADGNMKENGQGISIQISSKDRYLLEEMKRKMGYSGDIREYPSNKSNQKYPKLSIYRMEIVKDIKKIGGVANKSTNIIFPDVPKEYIPDFIRGYFDGDGSIYLQKNMMVSSIVSASRKFAYGLKKAIENGINSNRVRIYKRFPKGGKNNVYIIQMCGEITNKFGTYIYGDYDGNSKIKLLRKFERFIELRKSMKEFLPYEDAKEYVKKLNIKSSSDWRKWAKTKGRPYFIPSQPNAFYDEFENMRKWLGLDKEKYLSYSESKKYVNRLKIKTHLDWILYSRSGKKPINIPSSPEKFYKENGWTNWYDWLGNDRKYLSFDEAKKIARSMNISSSVEWYKMYKNNLIPKNISSCPPRFYANSGWDGWKDFLRIM